MNAIAPGIHLTDMVGQPSPDVVKQMGGYFLLGMPEDADVAAAAAYLASPDGEHLSAQILTTNGGSA